MEKIVKINCGVVMIRGGTWAVNKKLKNRNQTEQSKVR